MGTATIAASVGWGSAIVLGLVEGLTEFIPVSSTGHLVLARHLLGLGDGGLAFDAALQAATSLAILCYFWRDVWALIRAIPAALSPRRDVPPLAREGRAIVVAAIPIVVLGLLLKDFIEAHGRGVGVVATGLLAGAWLLWLGDRRLSKGGVTEGGILGLGKAAIWGCFQALSLWPGVSRSGSTIAGGAFLGMSREEAARFSFVAGLPVLIGAGGKELLDLWKAGELSRDLGPLLLSCAIGFAVGYASIGFLMRYLRGHTLRPFVWYRAALAAAVLATVWLA